MQLVRCLGSLQTCQGLTQAITHTVCCTKKKKSFTIVEQAISQVKGFEELYQDFDDKIRVSGQSSSTLKNYARKVAQTCIHFGKLPQDISEKELNKPVPFNCCYRRGNFVPVASHPGITPYACAGRLI